MNKLVIIFLTFTISFSVGSICTSCPPGVSCTINPTTDLSYFGTTTFANKKSWYQLVGTGEDVQLSTCNGGTFFATSLAVYSSSDCTTLLYSSSTICSTQSSLKFTPTSGTTYYIVLTGATVTDYGLYQLDVQYCPCSTVTACCNGCKYRPTTIQCYGKTDQCDHDVFCTGTSSDCGDYLELATTKCYTQTDLCDHDVHCDHTVATCGDHLELATTKCYTKTDLCDHDVQCDHTLATCGDHLELATTKCYTKTDLCDHDVQCDHTLATCGNHYKDSNTICHASTGHCDASEYCSGSGTACPPDGASLCPVCNTITDPTDCNTAFTPCKWCGTEGCQNENITTSKCSILTCTGATMYADQSYPSFTHNAPCPSSENSIGSIEYLQLVTNNGAEVLSICIFLDVPNTVTPPIYVDITAEMYHASDITHSPINTQTNHLVPLNAIGYNKVTIPITATWTLTEPSYVGIKFIDVCPPLKIVLLTNTSVPNQYDIPSINKRSDSTVIVRDPSGTPPPFSTVPIPGGMFVSVTNGAFCGDGIVTSPEECDGGYMCKNCSCPLNLEPDSVNGCQCSTSLPVLHGHWFTAPPTIITSINGNNLTVTITLPQTSPHRWSASTQFVHFINGTALLDPIIITMIDDGCNIIGIYNNYISWMIMNLAPQIIQTPKTWELMFGIDVTWLEYVQLTKKGDQFFVNRSMHAKLSFRLIIQRFVDINSTIWILDPGLLWAYVSKSYVIIDNNPRMVLEITTHVKSDGLTVDPNTFIVLGHIGAFISSTTHQLSLVDNETSDGSMQKWTFTVYFDGTLCTTSINDNFTIQYTLVSATSENIDPQKGNLTLTLFQMENWCTVNETITLSAISTTYLDTNYLRPATRFFTLDLVYVMVDVIPEVDMVLDSTSLEMVKVSGAALGDPTPFTIYKYNGGSPITDSNYNLQLTTPTICNYPNRTCYFFTLPNSLLVNRPLTITSTVSIVLYHPNDEKRTIVRSLSFEQSSTISRISILSTKSNGHKPEVKPTTQVPEKQVEVVYKASPALITMAVVITVVPLISLLVTVFIVMHKKGQTTN